jgi:hypothetical protein
MLSGADSSGSAEGTSRAAVENGTVIVRDKANHAEKNWAVGNENLSLKMVFNLHLPANSLSGWVIYCCCNYADFNQTFLLFP